MFLEKSLKCVSALFFLLHRDAQRVAPAAPDCDFVRPCWCAAHAMCVVCCEEKKKASALYSKKSKLQTFGPMNLQG